MPLNFTPHEEREDLVLILAKRSGQSRFRTLAEDDADGCPAAYFYYHWHSPPAFWTALSKDPSFKLISTVADFEEGKPLPEGLTTVGKQTREDYEALVGSVKVMLGIGQPMISPSVYSALCQGTPVVLPVFEEEHKTGGWWDYAG